MITMPQQLNLTQRASADFSFLCILTCIGVVQFKTQLKCLRSPRNIPSSAYFHSTTMCVNLVPSAKYKKGNGYTGDEKQCVAVTTYVKFPQPATQCISVHSQGQKNNQQMLILGCTVVSWDFLRTVAPRLHIS